MEWAELGRRNLLTAKNVIRVEREDFARARSLQEGVDTPSDDGPRISGPDLPSLKLGGPLLPNCQNDPDQEGPVPQQDPAARTNPISAVDARWGCFDPSAGAFGNGVRGIGHAPASGALELGHWGWWRWAERAPDDQDHEGNRQAPSTSRLPCSRTGGRDPANRGAPPVTLDPLSLAEVTTDAAYLCSLPYRGVPQVRLGPTPACRRHDAAETVLTQVPLGKLGSPSVRLPHHRPRLRRSGNRVENRGSGLARGLARLGALHKDKRPGRRYR